MGAREKESRLQNDQFNCRFQVQTDRIVDLEQQQSSLYTAFELLRQEVSAQDNDYSTLKSSLDEADFEIARQLEKKLENERMGTNQIQASSPARSNPQSGLSS